jgi:hypothetical protein
VTKKETTACVVALVTNFLIQIFIFALITNFEMGLKPMNCSIFQTMKGFGKSSGLTTVRFC